MNKNETFKQIYLKKRMSCNKNIIGCCIKQDSKSKLTYIRLCDLKGEISDITHEYNFFKISKNKYRRELLAIIEVLKIFPNERIMVVINSKYITNLISDWIPEWEKEELDKDLPNKDLIEELLNIEYKRIQFIV